MEMWPTGYANIQYKLKLKKDTAFAEWTVNPSLPDRLAVQTVSFALKLSFKNTTPQKMLKANF